MGSALRRNLGLTCPYCLGVVWATRRQDIDDGRTKLSCVARVLVGRRVGARPTDGTKSPPRASIEVWYSRVADLPEGIRTWAKQRALAALKTWLDWGLLTRDELRDLAGAVPTLPVASFARGAPVRPTPPALTTAGGSYGGTTKASWG
jgi:hypothetical protein